MVPTGFFRRTIWNSPQPTSTTSGLYAYGRQPRAVFRNLVRLADSLRPLAPQLALASALSDFEPVFEKEITTRLLGRLGLAPNGDTEPALIDAVYAFLEESGIGYDRFFFDLYGGLRREQRALSGEAKEHYTGPRWDELRAILEIYAPASDVIPAYYDGDRPCTLLIDEIESIWSAIAEHDDWNPFHRKIEQIRDMGAARATLTPAQRGLLGNVAVVDAASPRLGGTRCPSLENEKKVAQPVAGPVATASVSKSSGHYGIGDVIRLLRTLPVDQHAELVVRVIRTTLESVNVHVSDLVEDASKQQQKLGDRITTLQAQIQDLSKQIDTPPRRGRATRSRARRDVERQRATATRRARRSAGAGAAVLRPRAASPANAPAQDLAEQAARSASRRQG